MSDLPTKIAVKRDGPRGWHYIARANYNPKVHELHQVDPLDHDADGRKGGSMPDEPKVRIHAEAGKPLTDPAFAKFDPDGDGHPGGSLKGAASTATKGAAKKRKGKK